VHNGGESLKRCLASVAEMTPPPAEVLVVLDGDPQGEAQVPPGMATRVLSLPDRSGPARARNAGARASSGEVLLFVDADVVVPRDTVGRVDELFTQEPDLTAVFGSYDDDPPRVNFLSQYKNLSHHYFHQRAPEEASTFWAGCGAIRRSAFLAAGGFDEGYGRPSVEDIELGYRLKRAGHRIRLCKSLQVKHLKVWTAGGLVKTEILDRAVPWTRSILRYRDVASGPNLLLSSRLSVVSAYGLVVSALGALAWRGSLAFAAGFLVVLLAANAPLYVFFWRRRGLLFALQGMVWNWFYYLYGGVGFVIGLGLHVLKRGQPCEGELGPAQDV
jgi:GT2 family glycosyltransferase